MTDDVCNKDSLILCNQKMCLKTGRKMCLKIGIKLTVHLSNTQRLPAILLQ